MISLERFRRPAGWRIGECPVLSRHCRDGIVPQPSVSAFLTRLSSGWPTRPPFLIIGARKPAGVSPLPLRLAAPGVGSIAPHPCKKRKDGPPANNTTQYAYDTESNLTSITDANGHTTQFAYNPRGWVTQTTFPSSLAESYTDDMGNLPVKTDRKNQTIQYVYDALYRLA